jgi:hypothetical protein
LTEIIAPRKPEPVAPTKSLPPGTPNGAIAKCGDGQFVYAASDNTCGGHSGVAEWYVAGEVVAPKPAQRVAPATEEAPKRAPTWTPKVLIGKSQAMVASIIGQPSFSQGNTWAFDTDAGTLRVTFDKGNVVSSLPNDFDLGPLMEKVRMPPARKNAQAPKSSEKITVPTGAVARCKDNTFVFVATGSNTCKRNGGVAEWYQR